MQMKMQMPAFPEFAFVCRAYDSSWSLELHNSVAGSKK